MLTDRHLPPRVRERKLIEHVGKGLAGNADIQIVDPREVRQPLTARWMFLREEQLALATTGCAPVPQAALERTQLRRPVFTGMTAL
jgi:hypothetical protein